MWDSWLRKLFYSRQLYTTIFVWRLFCLRLFCTLSRASSVVDPHVVDAHFADFIYPIQGYGHQMRCKHLPTNCQLYDKASGLMNFKATMATGCCGIFGILKLFTRPLSWSSFRKFHPVLTTILFSSTFAAHQHYLLIFPRSSSLFHLLGSSSADIFPNPFT